MWIVLAFGSAVFAGLSSILAKCGIKKTSSEVATAIRTAVVLVMAFVMVLIVGSLSGITSIPQKSWIFLVLSGFATGASWLCFFKALQLGDVNKVIPVDKSSTVLTLIFAFCFFDEKVTAAKILAVLLIGVGTFLMIEKKPEAPSSDDTDGKKQTKASWLLFAVLSAVFASLTSILGKVGIESVESNLWTFIRTAVVLVMSWVVVFVTKKQGDVKSITKGGFAFIVLSGLATGASWLCYYKALKDGLVSVVVPVDKLSILVTIGFSVFVLKEKMSAKAISGLFLIVAGTIMLLV